MRDVGPARRPAHRPPARCSCCSRRDGQRIARRRARSAAGPYRHAWGLVKRAEALFGAPLIESGRGRGSALTDLARKLIWADRRIAARLSPLLGIAGLGLERDLEAQPGAEPRRRAHRRQPWLRGGTADGADACRGAAGGTALPQQPGVGGLAGRAATATSPSAVADRRVRSPRAAATCRWLRPDTHCPVRGAAHPGPVRARGNPKNVAAADLQRADLTGEAGPKARARAADRTAARARRHHAEGEVLGFDDTELTHAAVAAYIASGMG